MAAIRDETGETLYGIRPDAVLKWALKPWSQKELAEFREFVLVDTNLAFKREERRVLEHGGRRLEPDGISGKTYFLNDDRLVGIFNLSKLNETSKKKSRERKGISRILSPPRWITHHFDLRVDLSHDASIMCAFARTVIRRREENLCGAELEKASNSIHNDATLTFYRRFFLSPYSLLCMVIWLLYQALKAPAALFEFVLKPLCKNSGGRGAGNPMTSATGEGIAPEDTPYTSLKPENEPLIRNVSGEVLFGVDPVRLAHRTLNLWQPDVLVSLAELILVGDERTRKQIEAELVRRRAKPLYKQTGTHCTYLSNDEGAIAIADFSKARSSALERSQKSERRWIRYGYTRWAYKMHVQTRFLSDLQEILAWAQAAGEPGASRHSKKQIEERKVTLYFDFLANKLPRKACYWTTNAQAAAYLLIGLAHRRISKVWAKADR